MADLPHPWDTYARLQAELSNGHRLTDQSWGTEAKLDAILLSLQTKTAITSNDLKRTAASERRRERHRAHLRLVYLGDDDMGAAPEEMLAAREGLRILQSRVLSQDWSVLCQLAEGYSYADVAARMHSTPGALRVRVLRCRQQLAKKAA